MGALAPPAHKHPCHSHIFRLPSHHYLLCDTVTSSMPPASLSLSLSLSLSVYHSHYHRQAHNIIYIPRITITAMRAKYLSPKNYRVTIRVQAKRALRGTPEPLHKLQGSVRCKHCSDCRKTAITLANKQSSRPCQSHMHINIIINDHNLQPFDTAARSYCECRCLCRDVGGGQVLRGVAHTGEAGHVQEERPGRPRASLAAGEQQVLGAP
jgi:hypothetical protein